MLWIVIKSLVFYGLSQIKMQIFWRTSSKSISITRIRKKSFNPSVIWGSWRKHKTKKAIRRLKISWIRFIELNKTTRGKVSRSNSKWKELRKAHQHIKNSGRKLKRERN